MTGAYQGPPAEPSPSGGYMQPHRGVMILVLGIVGIVLCFPVGIAAWVMGNNDLREMAARHMDASGQGLTTAGKILGIVSVCLAIVGIAVWVLVVGMFAALGRAHMR